MSSSSSPLVSRDALAIDPAELTKAAINALRIALGIVGVLGVGLGIALIAWPGKTLVVGAAIAAIFFLIGGLTRVAIGTFSRDISGGFRALSIILGLVLILGAIVTLKNLDAATAVLTIIMVIMIGLGWIIEGIVVLVETGRTKGSAWAYVQGAIGILAGIVLLVVPGWSALWLVTITGIMFVILGALSLVRAFTFGRHDSLIEA